jgi:hypothetical protein
LFECEEEEFELEETQIEQLHTQPLTTVTSVTYNTTYINILEIVEEIEISINQSETNIVNIEALPPTVSTKHV